MNDLTRNIPNDPNPTEEEKLASHSNTSLQLQVIVLWGLMILISGTLLVLCAGALAGKIDSNERRNIEQDQRLTDIDTRLQKLEPKSPK